MGEKETALEVRSEETSSVHLIACNPIEMQSANADLIVWLNKKLTIVEGEIADLNASLEEARSQNWGMRSLKTQRDKAIENEGFYFKLLKAIEAGYTIVPDFPLEIFAIRVGRAAPTQGYLLSDVSQPRPYDEEPDVMPPGHGEYVSAVPKSIHYDRTYEPPGRAPVTSHITKPTEFRDVIFPLRAARHEVMSATAKAMALKVFDQIGICPAERKPDPLIIGQVFTPLRAGARRKSCSFIIAWHLDLRML